MTLSLWAINKSADHGKMCWFCIKNEQKNYTANLSENQCEIAYKGDNFYQGSLQSVFFLFALMLANVIYWDHTRMKITRIPLFPPGLLYLLNWALPPSPTGCFPQLRATYKGKNNKEHRPWIRISFIHNNIVFINEASSDWIVLGVFTVQWPRLFQRWTMIFQMNHYPADSVVCFVITYPLDSDLSGR